MANVYLNKNKEQRVQGGHPWVFRSDIAEVQGDHIPGGVVRVLSSRARWYGVTYQADKPQVQEALRQLAKDGLYPDPMWA